MSDPFDNQPFPRGALLGLGGLVLFSLLAVILAQSFDYRAGEAPPDTVVEQRDLRFIDAGGGVVHVQEAAGQARVLTLQAGTENFIRGVMRSMARERRSLELDAQMPFRLARHSDGRLTLEDLATGRRIDLNAFGNTNAGSFAQLLETPAAGS